MPKLIAWFLLIIICLMMCLMPFGILIAPFAFVLGTLGLMVSGIFR